MSEQNVKQIKHARDQREVNAYLRPAGYTWA